MLWLEEWLKRNRGNLPLLSLEAVRKFASMVSGCSCDRDFRDTFNNLRPYLIMPECDKGTVSPPGSGKSLKQYIGVTASGKPVAYAPRRDELGMIVEPNELPF
ncbi:MAG: hypothetical protein ACXAC5_02075 [Promethearchaeota archaeon]